MFIYTFITSGAAPGLQLRRVPPSSRIGPNAVPAALVAQPGLRAWANAVGFFLAEPRTWAGRAPCGARGTR